MFALELYAEHFGVTILFKEKIDVLLQNSDKDITSRALNLAIRYKPKPDWMIERLQKNWDWWKREFVNLWVQSPEYIEKIFEYLSLPEDEIITLATTVRQFQFRRYPPRSFRGALVQPVENRHSNILKIGSPLEQLITMLQCMRLVSYLDRMRSTYRSEELVEEVKLSLLSTRKIPKTFIENLRFIPDLDNILQIDDLFPWLRIQLWRLYWYLNEPNSVNLARFHQDIQTICQEGNLPETFWHHAFRDSWPLLDLYVQQKAESMEKLLPFLEVDKQSFVTDQIKHAIEKYIEAPDSSSSERLVTAIRTGVELDTIFPELATLAEQMGVNLKDLVNIHCRIRSVSSERQALTAQTVDTLLTLIEESKDDVDRLNYIIMFLTNSTWTPTPSNLTQAKRSLEALLTYWEMTNEVSLIKPSLMLTLQILAYDDTCLDIMPRMFSALAQAQTDKLYLWSIRNTLDDLTPDILAKLQTFLKHKDGIIQTGALIFWKYVIDAIFFRRGLKNEFEKIREIRFDPLFGLSFAQDNNEERSLGGIALLTRSDYPVQDQEYQQILLTLIQESINTSKESAWVRFLREAPIQDTSRGLWHDMLQNILDESGYYSRSILNAAMERYQKLSHRRIEATFYL